MQNTIEALVPMSTPEYRNSNTEISGRRTGRTLGRRGVSTYNHSRISRAFNFDLNYDYTLG